MNRTRLTAIVLLLISTIGTAYALVSLTQQTPVIRPPALPALSSQCTSLVAEGAIQPVSGVILLDCGPSTPAFKVVNENQASFTATFTLPSVGQGTVSPLEVSQVVNQCAQGTGFILTSGQSVPLPSGDYDYCLGYGGFPATGGQSIPSFSIGWT